MSSSPTGANPPPEDGTPPPPEATLDSAQQAFIDAMANFSQTLARTNTSSNACVKLREPDPFDGSDPKKLCTFLVQCKLNIQAQAAVFANDTAKVNYVLTFLCGTALDWFETGIMDPKDTDTWIDNYNNFKKVLRTNFGPYNAEAELENLKMKETYKVTKYMVDFNCLATQTEWDKVALRQQFYKGLPNQIKDEIACIGKPNNLNELCTTAAAIDACYWERHAEVTQETSKSSSPQKNDKPNTQSGNSSSNPNNGN